MKLVNTNIGRCLTMTYREDISEVSSKYKQFVHVSQWNGKYNTQSTKLLDSTEELNISTNSELKVGMVTFGLNDDDGVTIEYLGHITDSSD